MTEIYRFALDDMAHWFKQSKRKPLVLRGARQVGKSTLVRMFANQQSLELLSLDFEKIPDLALLFESNEPKKILELLSNKFSRSINPNTTLLFLDEIQKTPQVLLSLRYFYEEMPNLAIVAAGSLLDLALKEINFSMPVGRISNMYLGPLSFKEFLRAMGHEQLMNFLTTYKLQEKINLAIHQQLLDLLKTYFIVGGLPESITSYSENNNIVGSEQAKQELIINYQDDFAKYATKSQQDRMRLIFNTVPKILGEKFGPSKINKEEKSIYVKEALEKLVLAKLITKVCKSDANGLPLGAELHQNFFKTYLLDVGLVATALDLNYFSFPKNEDLTLINSGKIAEQFIAQHLLNLRKSYEAPSLYYWVREQKSSSAEVDFVIAHQGAVIPIEVKAGACGTLKSLHLFLQEKKLPLGVRFSSQLPSITNETINIPRYVAHKYQLLSLPLYLVEEVYRLLSEM